MKIIEGENQVQFKLAQDFEPKHIFECGQCFRWNLEEDGSYTGVAFGKILNVKRDGENIVFNNTNKEDFNNIWISYFDLNNDYSKIKKFLSKEDNVMKDAIEFGHGIRILNQDPWETIVSFIISARNGIARIKKSVDLISRNHGDSLGMYKGKEYYSFPTPEIISKLTDEELKLCGVGYRSKYILDTAKLIVEENIDLEKLKQLNTEKCNEEVLKFSGVGPKVASCILLFAMEKTDSFPVDVWVKRVMEHFYFKEDTPNKRIEEESIKRFGQYSGYAQQYLFYYARELGIGK